MESVKVLFLHKAFVQGGGVERVHKNLAIALNQQNIETCFYVHNADGESEIGFASLASEFKAYSPNRGVGIKSKIHYLVSLIKERDITAIIAATETANMLAFACSLVRRDIKVVYTRHCAFDVSDQKLPAWAIKFLYNIYVTTGAIVTVSDQLRETLSNNLIWRSNKVSYIPNAVVNDRVFELAKQNTDARDDEQYFCAVGRLVEQKGFDTLIDAYAKAKQLNPSIPKLLIAGEGEDKHSLLAQRDAAGLTDTIEFIGFTTNPYFVIKNSVGFILSSRHEGMPTVLIEAMALGVPAIAFDCPTGPSELIVSGKNGMLIPNQDTEAMAHAIAEYSLLTQYESSSSVSQFTYDSVAKAYLDQIGSVYG